MLVTVKAFGLASAFLQKDLDQVFLQEGATLEELIEIVKTTEANMNFAMLEGATFLINKENAGRQTILADGDEVIIMVRMAGG